MLSRILSTLNSISLSGYGNVATSLTSKTSYQDHFARTAGVSSAFSLASRLDSPRTAQQRDGGTQPGHVASPRCRSSRPERDVHLRAVVQPIALWATIPAWLYMWLWINYGLIFVGQIRAWWIPYRFHSETGRAADYRTMFSKCSATHTTSCPFVRACPEHRARHARFGNRSHAVHSSRALKTGSPARVVDAAADPETSALSRPRLAVRFCGYHTPALFGDGPVLLSANHQNADWGTR